MKPLIKSTVAACLALCLAGIARADEVAASPYAGEQTRSIKSLSDRDIAGLLDGQGAGYAKAAELNGYPGPAHTLELKEPLALRPDQLAATTTLLAAHKRRARALGGKLVQAERRLDALFADHRAEPADVERATREVALLQASLRAEHLNTHLAQTAVLDAEQVSRYAVLRGYVQDESRAIQSAPAAHRHH